MSLTAYNGCMTKNGIEYLIDETNKRYYKFIDLVKENRYEGFIELLIEIFDNHKTLDSLYESLKFNSINCDKSQIELEGLFKRTKKYGYTIFRFMVEYSNLMAYDIHLPNKFNYDLKLVIDQVDSKTLVYPATGLKEDSVMKILHEYLDDWYAQNQTDPDEDVDPDEWEERCNDWYKFNENPTSLELVIFNNIDIHKRPNLINSAEDIINLFNKKYSKVSRIKKVAINSLVQQNVRIKEMSDYFDYTQYLNTKKGYDEINNYIMDNKITVTDIDAELITNKKLCEILK